MSFPAVFFLFFFLKTSNPAGIYMLKVSNRNTRKRCETSSSSTIKIPKRRQWYRFLISIHSLQPSLFPCLPFVQYFWSLYNALHKKCPYSEFSWSSFFRLWTEHKEIFRNSQYSVRMRENTDQKNSEFGHFLRSDGKHIDIGGNMDTRWI